MPLGGRRAGRALRFDVFNASGELVIRNIDAAAVVATYCTSLTAEEVIAGVAGYSKVVSDTYFVAAHMSVTVGVPAA